MSEIMRYDVYAAEGCSGRMNTYSREDTSGLYCRHSEVEHAFAAKDAEIERLEANLSESMAKSCRQIDEHVERCSIMSEAILEKDAEIARLNDELCRVVGYANEGCWASALEYMAERLMEEYPEDCEDTCYVAEVASRVRRIANASGLWPKVKARIEEQARADTVERICARDNLNAIWSAAHTGDNAGPWAIETAIRAAGKGDGDE